MTSAPNQSRAYSYSLKRRQRADGFSLVELAIGILVIALLLGSILVPLSTQVEQRKISETQKALGEIKEALIGFALTQGYFPCPAASTTNGSEGMRTTGVCNDRQGLLPWAALGTPKLDAWGHAFRYSVSPNFSNSTSRFSMTSAADISIDSRDATGTVVDLSNANEIPVVVYSVGRNGNWGTNDDGNAVGDVSGTNVDEDTNSGGTGQVFFSRTLTTSTAITGGEFDDIIDWISPMLVFNRMVAAGKLPRSE